MFNRLALITWKTIRALDRPAPPLFGEKGRRRPHGVALIIALVTIAIVSTAAIEFAYSSRVNLSLASNERDNLKSYYLARSGVNISRLLLAFQFSLQDEARDTDDDMGRLIGRAMRRSNFQMYQYIDLLMGPFNSGRIESPVGGINLTDTGIGGFGEFTGKFDVDVVPEEGRIDLNMFARDTLREGDLMQLCSMMIDPMYDKIFEQKDKHGELMDRATVIQHIIDYIDHDEEATLLGDDCTVRGSAGDERRPYDRDSDHRIRPRNAKLTHVEELYQVHGVTEPLMRAFNKQFTVYGVGRPNLNVATAPVLYSVLCQNAQLGSGGRQAGATDGQVNICARDPNVGMQILWFAMALDGIRAFFEDPLSVLLAYVGTTESRLLPSAQVGQPVAYLTVSQLPSYLGDLRNNPQLMAQFLSYSPTYQQIVSANPMFMVDPITPAFPQWTVEFNRNGLTRAVTARTPSVYRIRSHGVYGTTKVSIETVVDFGRTLRRLPTENDLVNRDTDPEEVTAIREMLKEETDNMARGRVLFWREY